MSNIIERSLAAVFGAAAAASSAAAVARDLLIRKFTYSPMRFVNTAAVTGTNAVAELAIGTVNYPARLVEAKLVGSSGGITANATHYLTLKIAARLAATPFTSRNLITFAADTTTTDDVTQWDEKDLMTYVTATATDLDVAEGEVITAEVTKTGTNGLSYPAGVVELRFRPRDT